MGDQDQKVTTPGGRPRRWITFRGETHCLTEWADLMGLAYTTLKKRLDSGMSVEDALTHSPGMHGYRHKKKHAGK